MKARKLSRGRIFLVVSMVTGIIMAAAGIGIGQDSNLNFSQEADGEEWTDGKLDENETVGNLRIDLEPEDLAVEQVKRKRRHEFFVDSDHYSAYYGAFRTPYNRDYYHQYVVCFGENVTSLSAIECGSVEACDGKKACLLDEKKCNLTWSLIQGYKCPTYYNRSRFRSRFRSSLSDDDSDNVSCLRVEINSSYKLFGAMGLAQCISEEDGVNVTTFDHYKVLGSGIEHTFLSSVKNVTSDFMEMKLYVTSLKEDLNNKTIFGEGAVILYEDEEVSLLQCLAPRFVFHGEEVVMRVYRKDGSTIKLAEEMISTLKPYHRWRYQETFVTTELVGFRVPADVVAFSCAAQRTNLSGEWVENRINITVPDIPSQVVVKSSNSSTMTLNLTLGSQVSLHCKLTGSSELQTSIRRQMSMESYAYDAKSKSIVEFLRFQQVAGEHWICAALDKDYSAHYQSNWTIEHENQFGDERLNHFIFNLTSSVPKIYKPPTSNLFMYLEDKIVEQTVFCSFGGEPKPRISWIKNSIELFSTNPIKNRYDSGYQLHQMPGNETIRMERVELKLGAKTIQPADFKPGKNGQKYVNLSCIVRNQFGSDRLDFMITRSDEFTEKYTENPKAQAESETPSKTMAFVTIFIVQDFLVILGFFGLWKKRSARFLAERFQNHADEVS